MFKGMEYVYEVYKEKSISKAAKNLYISQPSLSANLKRIEKQIGYPIFDRTTKPLRLTECGEEYIKAVESIMVIENHFANFVNDWGNLKIGNLIIGGSSLFASWVLPPFMAEFTAHYPEVELTLIEENTQKLQEMLLHGKVDLMLDNCVLDGEIFEQYKFREEYLMLAVPADLAVNEEMKEYQISVEKIRNREFLASDIKDVPLERFKEEPFVLLKPENDTRKRAMDICKLYHFHPKMIFELDQQMTSYNLTCSGMGISFISDTLISSVPELPNVIYYKLPKEISCRNLYFYWKKGRYFKRTMEEFLKLVQDGKVENPER